MVIRATGEGGTVFCVRVASIAAYEWQYMQLEREALSLVYGIQKFYQYIYERDLKLLTDHHPLMVILRP